MTFFEDLGKKMSQTGQDALKKTKLLAEKTKLTVQISSEKRVIEDNYLKLGEKYFELFCNDPNESLKAYITAIKEAQSKIDELEDQINKLMGVETCPNCGAEIEDGAQFCAACGTKLPEETPEDAGVIEITVRICRNCEKEIPEGAQFCAACGAKAE